MLENSTVSTTAMRLFGRDEHAPSERHKPDFAKAMDEGIENCHPEHSRRTKVSFTQEHRSSNERKPRVSKIKG
jgi:hypothetical protein